MIDISKQSPAARLGWLRTPVLSASLEEGLEVLVVKAYWLRILRILSIMLN